MKTVNSLSGGKTSSYMAVHYPADYNLFALVIIEDKSCTPKDGKFVQMVSDKIGKEFIATAESDKTLKVIFDLEQMTGKEIIWVTGDTFEMVCRKRKALANQMQRFCTTEMKMKPIFDYWRNNINDIVKMRVGYRFDELDRAVRFTTKFKTIIGRNSTDTRNKWGEIEWRVGDFPLIENKVTHFAVNEWAKKTDLIFPPDSNCVGCFHKPYQQLRKNWDDEPQKMQWFSNMEKTNYGNRRKPMKWKKEMNYEQAKKIGLQQDFFFGTGSGCQAGFCTD